MPFCSGSELESDAEFLIGMKPDGFGQNAQCVEAIQGFTPVIQ